MKLLKKYYSNVYKIHDEVIGFFINEKVNMYITILAKLPQTKKIQLNSI